jgi:uncharacterized membrane protein YeiH
MSLRVLLISPISSCGLCCVGDLTLDAARLALCAIAGAGKAMEFGINPLLSVLMGAVTGVGEARSGTFC